MQRTIAFYDHFVSGHHVEYLYQIVKAKIDLGIEDYYIFIVPRKVEKLISELIDLKVLQNNNVRFHFLEQYAIESEVKPTVGAYKKQLNILRNIVLIEKVDHCVFMLLNNYLQVVLGYSMARSLGCDISGILMDPFGTIDKKGFLSLAKHMLTIRIYFQIRLMLFNPRVKNIFVIIDEKTTKLLNTIHFTNKFIYVSDPVLELKHLNDNPGLSTRTDNRIKFLLFGSLSKRKGIFTMLKCLRLLSKNDLAKIQVVFAGRLSEDDRDLFLKRFHEVWKVDSNAVKIIDRYLAYKDIPELFGSVDYVVMPYQAGQASSGILGHIAYYQIPVIASGHGIIKEHINTYSLGLAVKNLDAAKLSTIIREIVSGERTLSIDKDKAQTYLSTRNFSFFGRRLLLNV